MGSLYNLYSLPALTSTMKAICLLVLFCLIVSASAEPKTDQELLCNVCVDVVTDLDEWITDDKTEQEIVEFVEQLCTALGSILPDLEATCIALIESQLPAIIDSLINDYVDPQEVCNSIGACP